MPDVVHACGQIDELLRTHRHTRRAHDHRRRQRHIDEPATMLSSTTRPSDGASGSTPSRGYGIRQFHALSHARNATTCSALLGFGEHLRRRVESIQH